MYMYVQTVIIVFLTTSPLLHTFFRQFSVITFLCLGMTYLMEKQEFYQFYYAKLQENMTAELEKHPQKIRDESFINRFRRITKETITIYLNLGLSVWHYMFITLLNFTITLCVFPAVTVLVESYDSDPQGLYEIKKNYLSNARSCVTNLVHLLQFKNCQKSLF